MYSPHPTMKWDLEEIRGALEKLDGKLDLLAYAINHLNKELSQTRKESTMDIEVSGIESDNNA